MWIMENDPECLYLTFSVEEEVFGMVSERVIFMLEICKHMPLMSAYVTALFFSALILLVG